MFKRFAIKCRFLALAPVLRRLEAFQKQLDRMEDRIVRIEAGLEKTGVLAPETRANIRNLDPASFELSRSFDYIYKHGIWGGSMCSGGGSYGEWAEKFVLSVKEFISSNSVRSITDIGCGDFNVGSQICPLVESYHAVDVSQEIITYNKNRFRDLPNVTFQQKNACEDALPPAELAIIRQVLQHLSNQQIADLLNNVARTGFKYALVAEHLPDKADFDRPNVDLASHSSKTRVEAGSGVCIDQPPFSRPAQVFREFSGTNGRLVVSVWKTDVAH